MNEPRPGSVSPHIQITREGGGVAITQHRPAVLSALTGMEVERACALVPTLLPVCGAAQSVAAARAVEAAREQAPTAWQTQLRSAQLWREQALSAAWRLAVDWPDLVSAERPMNWLKAVRGADGGDVAAHLRQALPGFMSVSTTAELRAWLERGGNVAADLVNRALAVTTPEQPDTPALRGEALSARARDRLRQDDFDPQAPVADAVEVGPRAMARDSLVPALEQEFGPGAAARLLAQLLDVRHIHRGLTGDAEDDLQPEAWSEGEGAGSGRALTARGPVYHRVELDSEGRVTSWRALAPTDWHFAPGGPAAAALAECTGKQQARLTAASFDPCAPWALSPGWEN